MDNKVIFETARIYQYPLNNDWVFEGRAYNDIYIGDIFSARGINPDKKVETVYLKLISLMTYGKVLDFLSSGLTGSLYIRTDSDLSKLKLESLCLNKPSFETRYRICTEILEKRVGNLPEDIKVEMSKMNKVAFFSEVMQFSYRYKSIEDIQVLIEKYYEN